MPEKKFKVLLLQLPFPLLNRSANEQLSTIPLAAGYLKASAKKEGLEKHCDIRILGLAENEFYGDAMLLETITAMAPELIGFSFYVWNINRSLYLIAEIKKRLPQTRIVIGGPGITRQYSFIGKPGVDIAVIGEGEAVFCAILRHFALGLGSLGEIRGICYRLGGRKIFTGAPQLLADVNDIASPYLEGCIDPAVYKRVWIESMRFCVYKCKYCLYPSRSARKNPYFLPERLEKEILLARKSGVRIVDLHDSAFNLSPHFNRLSDSLRKINRDRSMKLKVFLRAEQLTPRAVRQLRECNVVGAEVGLQSINPVVLKNIGRKNDLKKFLRGVKLLKQAGISVLVDIMCGLPGDSLGSIRRTLNFLKTHRLDKAAAYTILSVCPSTALWKEKKQLGLRIQRNPPYYVLRTPQLSFSQMKEAIALCSRQTVEKLQNSILHPQSNAFFPFMYTYSSGRYPRPETLKVKAGSNFKGADKPATLLIFDLEAAADWNEFDSEKLKIRLANNVVIWFKSADVDQDAPRIKGILAELSRPNPYTIWHIILETRKTPARASLKKIEAGVFFKINHWDYQNVFSQESLKNEYKRNAARMVLLLPEEEKSLPAQKSTQVMRSVYIEGAFTFGWINRLLRQSPGGLLLDFSPRLKAGDIMDCLKKLARDKSGRTIRFRNRLLQMVWDSGFSGLSVCSAGESDFIYVYGAGFKEAGYGFSREKIKFDALDWKLSLAGRI